MRSHLIAAQIVGGREKQEDDFAVLDLTGQDHATLVLVVADGMGGHPGAADAAKLATSGFCEGMRSGVGPLPLRLSAALHRANDAIAAAGRIDEKIDGAGCTLVAAVIEGNSLSWISVGDSSLYLFRCGLVRRLNERHLAISTRPGYAGRRSPSKVLRSSVSGRKIAAVDLYRQPVQLLPHDCIIVASDGLDCIGDRKLNSILRRSTEERPEQVVERLLSAVRARPIIAQDNTTIVFYRIRGEREHRIDAKPGSKRGRATWVLAVIGILSGMFAFAAIRGLLQ
jgi:serine/threonine protein phosphatase PrpC